MTIYKIEHVVERDTSEGKLVNVTVTRRKILGYMQDKLDAERFVRCYKLEYPLAAVTVVPFDVNAEQEEE